MTDREKCRQTAEHQAHMAINGECPWCGEYDDQQGGMDVDTAKRIFG